MSMSVADEDRLLEQAAFATILDLHPEHLTNSELALKVAGTQDRLDSLAVKQAIDTLRSAGLVRHGGDVVEPTHAAVHAAVLLGM
jgi:hypothetical protein